MYVFGVWHSVYKCNLIEKDGYNLFTECANPFKQGLPFLFMDWRELLEPTIPRFIITILLVGYIIFTIPLITMYDTSCREEGIDCTSTQYRVSMYYCLKVRFHEEFHSSYMYSVRDCNKTDFLQLFLIVPLLYVMSLPVCDQFSKSMYAWRVGSKNEAVTLGLLVATGIPGLLFGILEAGLPENPVTAYTVYPFGLLYICVLMVYSGEIIIPGVIITILAVIAYKTVDLFKKWNIYHAHLYAMWVLYLAVTLLGIGYIYVGPLP